MFRVVSPLILRSTYNCKLQHLAQVRLYLLPFALVEELELQFQLLCDSERQQIQSDECQML